MVSKYNKAEFMPNSLLVLEVNDESNLQNISADNQYLMNKNKH